MLRNVCMANRIVFVLISFLWVSPILAQKQKSSAAKAISSSTTQNGTVYYGNTNEPPRAVEFKEGTVAVSEFITNIRTYFNIPPEFSFTETESSTDQLGIKHRYLQQYHKGIAIDGMGYRVHEKNGFVKSANGKSVRSINIDVQTNLNEHQAFQNAVRALNTKDTTRQQGKKLIVSKNFIFTPESFSVAYVFDIDVSLIERWRISIDARTGQVINKVSLVHNCFPEKEKRSSPLPYGVGTGLTNYYGTLPIRIEKFDDGSSRLIGQTTNGGQIETYNYNNASVLAWLFGFNVPVYNFYSSTTEYNEPYQKVAVSVQWAAEQSYEYYFQTHNRNSYDNFGSSIRSYVHVDVGLNNAFWSRNTLLFGDGSNNNPLVELDVVAHELTHGVTQYEAQLQYYGESGALNESFSDIFGKAIEFNTFGDTATWQLAKYYRTGGLRDFSNPNLKNQPDTWLGDMWYIGSEDNGGVHYNSGVQNFWYYLLCQGGNGVNDNEEKYTVNAIGMDAASKIAYRNLSEYLSYYSDYLDSRIGSLLATADLYGKNSTIYKEVSNAWDAVGVIDEPIITNLELFDLTATTVKLKGTLVPRGSTVSYHFEYGSTTAYGSSSPSYQYIDKVEGTLTGLQSQTHYYVRLVATNENGSSYSSKEFTTISLAPLVKIKQTVDVTENTAILYGQINPNSLSTSYYFEYGLTPSLGSVTATYPLSDTTEFVHVSAPILNLQPRQTYYYRLIATNGFASTASSQLNIFTAVKPVIASISPLAAAVGSEVIITGDNFNPEAAKNAVHFGATRAKILSGTTTRLTVEVPVGASFGSVTLLDTQSGLIAQSVQEFVPTFSGEFKKGYLQLRMGISDLNIYKTKVQDMDGDNKPDIVALHYPGFSVLQNVNQGGDITDESFVRNTYNTEYSSNLWLVDMDGNGLKDVVLAYQNGLRIYPNLSVPGFIFFGKSIDLYMGAFQIVFGDFDQDGRIDIAGIISGFQLNNKVVIFRNQNQKGSLLVENFHRQTIDLPFYANQLNSFDVTNDGKPDAIASSSNSGYFILLKNKSQKGNFDFESLQIVNPSIRSNESYSAFDLNHDGWKDFISYKFYATENILVSENNGNPSNLNFASQTTALENQNISDIIAGDINGDSKVDFIVDTGNRTSIVLKNNTETGEHFSSTSFENYDKFGMFVGIVGNKYVDTNFSLNDLNGDGRPEVIAAYSYYYGPHDGYQMEIWQNAPASCIDPTTVQFEVYSSSVTIILPINATLDQFQIEYSLAGTNNWYPVSTKTFGVLIGATYEIRVRAKCFLGYSDFYYKTIITDCVNTSYFNLTTITPNSVSLQPGDLSTFEVQYSLSGLNQWITLPLFVNQITNLLPGTTYDIRFRGRCNLPADFNYRKFTTICPKLSSLIINDIRPNSAVVNWTSSYVGFAILEYSIDNINWVLIGFDRIMSSLIPAKTYYVRARFHCNNSESEFTYTSFSTPCPKVSNINIKLISPFSSEISWLDESNTGTYTVSYSLTAGGAITTVQTNSTFVTLNGLSSGGSYTVWIAPFCTSTKDFKSANFTTICFTPFNLATHEISYTTAKLTWSDSFSGVPYSIDYSIRSSGIWQTITTSETAQLLEGLRPATKYEVRVHINCPSIKPDYASIIFETNAYGETSIAPNPTDKSITLYPSKNLIGNTFSIYDNSGKLIVSGQLLDYALDLSLLSPGFYTLKIDGEKPLKIIKQ
jgi:Zn-dependent metalloprotease